MQTCCAPRWVSRGRLGGSAGVSDARYGDRVLASSESRLCAATKGRSGYDFRRTPRAEDRQYVDVVTRYQQLIVARGLDVLIVVLAVGAGIGTATGGAEA